MRYTVFGYVTDDPTPICAIGPAHDTREDAEDYLAFLAGQKDSDTPVYYGLEIWEQFGGR